MHRVVLALNKQKIVEIDAGAVDMSCAAVRRVPDGERVGRGDLVEIVEKGRVPVEGCVVERGDKGESSSLVKSRCPMAERFR